MKKSLLMILPIVFQLSIGLAQTYGNAVLVKDVDAFTDEDKSRVLVSSNETDYLSQYVYLVWRCNSSKGNKYDFYISGDNFLNSSSSDIPVRYRFDAGEASEWQGWTASTDGTTPFANERQSSVFTKGVLLASSVLVGEQDYNGSVSTYSFDLNGLKSALTALKCINLQQVSQTTDFGFRLTSFTKKGSDAYPVVIDALDGTPYMEDLNFIKAEGIEIHFRDFDDKSVVLIEGSDKELVNKIKSAIILSGGFIDLE